MIKVRRANTVLRVDPDTLDYYMGQGYSLIDENGKVIKEAIPTTKEELHRAYIKHTEMIAQLNAEIQELKGALEELKAKPTTKAKTTSKKK